MLREGVFFRAILCLALTLPTPLVAEQFTSYWYPPHLLPGVQDASDRFRLLAPHLSPVTVHGRKFYLQSGYALARADVSQFGIVLVFRKGSSAGAGQFEWNWGGANGTASSYTPGKSDIVASIVYGEAGYFQIWDLPARGGVESWCVVPMHSHSDRNDVLCVGTVHDAHLLVDVLATMVQASGVKLSPPVGMWADPSQELGWGRHNKQTAFQVSQVDWNGPPAKAGIRVGDIIYSVNGAPCVGKGDFLISFRQAAGAALEGGEVHVDLLRKGKPLSLALNYPGTEARASKLPPNQFGQPTAAAPSSGTSGFRLGIQVRVLAAADIAALRLPVAKGYVVASVDKGSVADRMQMQVGDILLDVNGVAVGDVQPLTQLIRSGSATTFGVWRNGQSIVLALPRAY